MACYSIKVISINNPYINTPSNFFIVFSALCLCMLSNSQYLVDLLGLTVCR